MIKQKTQKYLRDRFTNLAEKAVDLKNKIDTAKTEFKKNYYSKKLTKVNKEALDVLILINSSQQNAPEEKSIPVISVPINQEEIRNGI